MLFFKNDFVTGADYYKAGKLGAKNAYKAIHPPNYGAL